MFHLVRSYITVTDDYPEAKRAEWGGEGNTFDWWTHTSFYSLPGWLYIPPRVGTCRRSSHCLPLGLIVLTPVGVFLYRSLPIWRLIFDPHFAIKRRQSLSQSKSHVITQTRTKKNVIINQAIGYTYPARARAIYPIERLVLLYHFRLSWVKNKKRQLSSLAMLPCFSIYSLPWWIALNNRLTSFKNKAAFSCVGYISGVYVYKDIQAMDRHLWSGWGSLTNRRRRVLLNDVQLFSCCSPLKENKTNCSTWKWNQ